MVVVLLWAVFFCGISLAQEALQTGDSKQPYM